MGDLHPAREAESLQVKHEGKSIIPCDDMLPVSAGDAKRSGCCMEGYDLLDGVLCERCSSTSASVGDASCFDFEENEVRGDTLRELQRDGVLHSETQGRDRGNKEDGLPLEGCISMSSGVAVKEFLVAIDSIEEPTFEA